MEAISNKEANFYCLQKAFKMCNGSFEKIAPRASNQGQLQRWTEHSTLIFENLKPVEKSKNHINII